MKKIFAIGIALLGIVSCNMDFYKSNSMTSTILKENPNSAVYTTDGIYALFKDNLPYKGQTSGEDGNYYIRHLFQLSETRGDNVTISGNSEDPFTQPYQYKDIDNKKNKYYTWWMAYKIIYAANSNIDAINPQESSTSAHLLGENYFFRAIAHLNMVTLFAMPYACGRDNLGVPLRIGMDYSGPATRATVGEVYDAIVNDLESAIKYMDMGSPRGDASYVSATAARALLSRVYLNMGETENLQKCVAVCDELIKKAPAAVKGVYTLQELADYPKATWSSPETIWCIHLTYPADHTAPSATIGAMYNVTEESTNGWGEWYWSDELIELFNRYPEDRRFAAYFTYPWYPESVLLNDGKKMVCFPMLSKGNDFCITKFAMGCEPSLDGSYDFTCDLSEDIKKTDIHQFRAMPEVVDGYTRYYLYIKEGTKYVPCNLTGDDTFGHEGKSPCYIREDVDLTLGIRRSWVRYYNTKFSGQDGQVTMSSPAMLRWGEVFLNRAEAYARLQNVDKALEDVNLIRRRAGLPDAAMFKPADIVARGYDTVLDVVLDERRMELCFEGDRMFSVFRNKKALDRRYVGYHPFEVIEYDDPRIALLIPSDEVLATPGFPQNDQSKN